MAFIKDGYRYHTDYDGLSNIPLGSFQHVGDNTLSLIKALSNAPEISDQINPDSTNTVYYDFFGLFLVSYSENVGTFINLTTVIISISIATYAFLEMQPGKYERKEGQKEQMQRFICQKSHKMI